MSTLATDLARRLDPVALARTIGMEPDAWQRDVLRSRAKRILLNCSRQSGKTSTVALIALHRALYRPGALVLVLSKSERQGRELYRVALNAYRALARPVGSESENALSMELSNGSRIIVLPSVSGSIRGYSAVDLLVLDEAARIDDETYLSARPMVGVSEGTIIAASTPWGARGWWATAWRHEGAMWERYEVPAARCPRLSEAFLAEERAAMGDFFYASEYECRFLDAQSAAFREEDVEAMFDPELEPWL